MKTQNSNRLIRGILIFFGTLFLGLGILGIILPILPTTPFLLLSAACYSRGSDRFYKWLLRNRFFGKYIKNYRDGKGISLKLKIFVITILWISILSTSLFFVTSIIIRLILVIIATGVTIHLILMKTYK